VTRLLAYSLANASRRAGFTLVELIVVIAIIGILATLTAPEIGTLRDKAIKVVCVGHLRSLHCSLGAYLNDNEQWPQCPEELSDSDDEQFWIDSLKDYGGTESVWKCPSLTRRLERDKTTRDEHKIDYTPTPFDDNPLTPRKYASGWWLVEISAAHGGSNLLIRADGAVQTVSDAIKESQAGN
jgi:prepilin-type N-terminal cleavage/methylation domain-containing protein